MAKSTVERPIGGITEERLIREAKPTLKPLRRRPPRLVRWLQWLVVAVVVVGGAALGYALINDDGSAEVRADLLGTRYRETGVVLPVDSTPDVAEVEHLTGLSEIYLSRTGG
jgi:hypothetical protein